MSRPTKDDVVELLESIARLLELKGESPFKVRAYQNAARAVETYPGSLDTALADGTLPEIPGIGKSAAAKIAELLETGAIAYHDELRAGFPEGLFALFDLQGLGAKKIRALYEALGVASIADLEAVCNDGRLAVLPGFGAKTAANILQAIATRQSHAGRFLLSDAAGPADVLYESLREHPSVDQLAIAGSFRRRKEIIGDLDFLVSSKDTAAVMEHFTTHPLVEGIIAKGNTKSSVRLGNGLQADLRVVSNDEFPFALAYFTGSKEHNIALRNRALERGWTLNEYRLAPAPNAKESLPIPVIRTERELHRALDLDYIEPELREDLGEFAAAEEGTLPRLIELPNLRGTFHNHTIASDGRNTLEEMAEAAQELGLQYLGIADHSKSSFQAHGLSEERLLAQVAEIRKLNEEYGSDFRLFAGVECDILKDGSLDYSDEILDRLDYVVASVHASFTLPEAEMTRRIIRAISNPRVTMLGHLTGRLLLSRKPYAVDIPAVLDAAAETGTIIEINASPSRLDLDWRWWPLAKQKGVRCVINPDAHHTSQLQNLWYGVAIARKGWLTREDVVNCLPLGEVEKAIVRR